MVGLRWFFLLWAAAVLVFPAFEVAHSATTGTKSKTSVVSVSDPTFQSCKLLKFIGKLEGAILANQNLCITVDKQSGSLKGLVSVYLIGPRTIDERNAWINEVGKWLKTKGLDACEKTSYMTDPDSVKPPLAKEVAGIPGEKAFHALGGLESPSFCPQPCRWGSYRQGRCSKGSNLH